MKEFLTGLCMIGGPVLFVASLVGLIRPLPFAWLRKRATSLAGAIGALVVFIVGVSMLPTAPTASDSSGPANRAQTVAFRSPAPPSDTPSAAVPLTAPTHAQAVAEFEAADDAFLGATSACQMLKITPSRRDIYGVYEELSASRDYCEKAMSHAEDRLFGPAVPEPHRTRLNKAIRDCGLAYTAKYEAFDTTMKVANGDSSPEAVLEAEKWMAQAAIQVPECVKAYAEATAASGLDNES